jgi:hypothetical protein
MESNPGPEHTEHTSHPQLLTRMVSAVVIFSFFTSGNHRVRITSPLPLRVAKTGKYHLNQEITTLLPTGIGERF